MNINELTIGQVKEIAGIAANLSTVTSSAANAPQNPQFTIGQKVIVRSRDAGVLFGEYAGNDGSTIHLTTAIQMWKWFAAKGITLLDVATYGVKKSECKFSTAQAKLTVFNACALIEVTDEATKSLASVSA